MYVIRITDSALIDQMWGALLRALEDHKAIPTLVISRQSGPRWGIAPKAQAGRGEHPDDGGRAQVIHWACGESPQAQGFKGLKRPPLNAARLRTPREGCYALKSGVRGPCSFLPWQLLGGAFQGLIWFTPLTALQRGELGAMREASWGREGQTPSEVQLLRTRSHHHRGGLGS